MPYRRFPLSQYSTVLERYQNGESTNRIAMSYGVARATIGAVLRKQGVTEFRNQSRGPNHHMWKGGRNLTTQGYIRIHADPEHPFYDSMAVSTGGSRWFMEHRLVMAEYLGRPLRSDESVHHISGDKTDNRIENLQLRIGSHGNGQAWCCGDCGSSNIVPRGLPDA